MIAVYVHVPYCRTLCPYCDFNRTRLAGGVPESYLNALAAEIAAFEGPSDARSIFFGGGTPSLLAPAQLERILGALRSRFRIADAEISLEANSDDVTSALMDAWKALGVTRVSLGVQSFDDDVLRYLGRRHDAATARRACESVAARFDNWSMDLIFGARPVAAWDETLRTGAAFAPPHVSAYGLTYEPGTPFDARRGDEIDEDDYLRMYHRPEAFLGECRRYEVSNFARPGFECRHNLVYWHNEEYAGFGPGAYSFVNGVRARNTAGIDEYLMHPGTKEESVRLTDREVRVETLIQHLRLVAGLSLAYYRGRFGAGPHEEFGARLDVLRARGLIEECEDTLRPTRQGLELNNEIGLELVG